MGHKLFLSLALAAVGLLAAAASAQQSCAGFNYVVSRVELPSATNLTPAQQADVRIRLVGRCIGKSQLQEMSDRVRDAYQSFGYFQASVSEPQVAVLDNNRDPAPIALSFSVNEGPQFRLTKINFRGITMFQPEEIAAMSPLAVNDVFDTSKVRELLDGLRRAYAAKGFQGVSPWPKTEIVGHSVELTIIVDENASRAITR